MRQTSFKLWEGSSAFNGEQISLIITGLNGNSKNPKTGKMIQSWIVPTEINPRDTLRRPDLSRCVCGDCNLKPNTGLPFKESCYVMRVAFNAPRSVWSSNISRPVELGQSLSAIEESKLPFRWGAVGDPAMLPQEIFKLVQNTVNKNIARKFYTAYTHQHMHGFAYWIRRYAMASVENEWDGKLFRAFGFRTFRITSGPQAGPDELVCPNYTHNIPCIKCGLCNGKVDENDNRKSITIPRH